MVGLIEPDNRVNHGKWPALGARFSDCCTIIVSIPSTELARLSCAFIYLPWVGTKRACYGRPAIP